MTIDETRTALQLRSLVRSSGKLELSLANVPIPHPAADEVLVRIEATPINPSDLGLLFGAADMSHARYSGTPAQPVVTASISEAAMSFMAGRLGESLPVGNEGAGVVVEAGSSAAAQALLGKTVALLGGAMYAQCRCISAEQCLVLPPGTTAAEGASAFINPLTVLGMVETMRREGHSALAHTAAASNLGQMLNRLCLQDDIKLVNIVRKPEQVELLRGQGATYVCNSSAPTFTQDLVDAFVATGATIAAYSVGQQIAIAVTSFGVGFAALVFIFRFRSFKEVIAAGREARSVTEFPDVDVLIFGHSHIPWDTRTDSGLRLLNPGSPTDRRRQPHCTFMTAVAVDGELRDVVLHRVPQQST